MFYKEQLLNESNTEGPQTLFCPQKFCNYLTGRRKEPGFSQRFTGVRQEATDKFKYEKLRLNLRKKKFHLRVAEYWSPILVAQSNCGLSSLQILKTQLEKAPSKLIQPALLWAGGWDHIPSWGPSNLRVPMIPWNYTLGAPQDRFYCFFFLLALSSLSAPIFQVVSKLAEVFGQCLELEKFKTKRATSCWCWWEQQKMSCWIGIGNTSQSLSSST